MERVSVLLSPTAVTPAPKDLTNTGDLRFQSPWTFLGLPAISLPSGLANDGLPFGIQFAAGAFQEARLLSAAAWCERALGVTLAPPITMG
jgi:Asp-tRNA(Asn)/Glu-tRNA(Gln) amidotransferase A subunit family amidase